MLGVINYRKIWNVCFFQSIIGTNTNINHICLHPKTSQKLIYQLQGTKLSSNQTHTHIVCKHKSPQTHCGWKNRAGREENICRASENGQPNTTFHKYLEHKVKTVTGARLKTWSWSHNKASRIILIRTSQSEKPQAWTGLTIWPAGTARVFIFLDMSTSGSGRACPSLSPKRFPL